MFYVVALGNPGDKYKNTRHNSGWLALDYFIEENGLKNLTGAKYLSGHLSEGIVSGQQLSIFFPNTFMNNSGSAVVKFVSKENISNLIVVHDDIDLPFGEVRVVKGRGAGGNNGVDSIIKSLDTKDFIRIRIGIALKSIWIGKVKRPLGGGPLERFVLKPFSVVEKMDLPTIYKKVEKALLTIISEGVESAMNKVN